MNQHASLALVLAAMTAGCLTQAQAAKDKKPVIKPPVAQAWIDVATFSGMGMPAVGAAMNPMAMLGGMFGGSGGKNTFGNTVSGAAGSWLDVTLYTRDNPKLEEAIQNVPVGSKLAPELKLVSPRTQKTAPYDDEQIVNDDFEPPKGKIYLYWGCGDAIRSGQPRVLDMSKANIDEYRKFFISRRATQRGAHLAQGRPIWPNDQDARLVPAGASLVGEHAFKGQGVPASFKFTLPARQDIMPAVELGQRNDDGVNRLEWKTIPTARAYFLAAMGARESGDNEMVFWTSSEVPEIGTGLVDYQTNPAVDRWLKERVLLPPDTRTCAVPKGVFGEGAMLRMIAYGSELNLAYPPRPTDPTANWEPEWAAKVRLKSVLSSMLGMEDAVHPAASDRDSASQPGRENDDKSGSDSIPQGIGEGINKIKGIFGF
jgi:hypothetical protein